MLVRPDDVTTVILLDVLAAVVGVAAERVFGTARWAVLFLTGALAVHALLAHRRRQLVGPAVILAGAIVLTALTDIHGPAILAGAVVAIAAMRPVFAD